MPTITATFTNPQYVYSGGGSGKTSNVIPIAQFTKKHAFDSVQTATLHIRTDVAKIYEIETADATNALQLNSTVLIVEGAYIHFQGYVYAKPVFRMLSGELYLVVTCRGWDGILLDSICVDAAGNDTWYLESDTFEVTTVPMLATDNFGTFQGSTLWPDPNDPVGEGLKCYLKNDAAVQNAAFDALTEILLIGGTTAVLSTTAKAFVPRGWVRIENEWIYYDGYDNASGNYRLYNLKRAQLGTAAHEYAIGKVAYEQLGKQIAPRNCELEWNDGTGYITIRRGAQYDFHHKLGCFVLNEDATGVYKATYSVYDEDGTFGGTAITVDDILTTLLTGSKDYGGPGFVAGDLDLNTGFGEIKATINRYDYDPVTKPITPFDAIQDLMRSISLDERIKFWYESSTGKFVSKLLEDGAVSFTIPNMSQSEEERSLEDIFSAVRVAYTDDQNLNRATGIYSWHPEATGGLQDGFYRPNVYWGCAADSSGFLFDSPHEYTAAGIGGMKFTCDGKPDSKLGAMFDSGYELAGPCEFGHYYFGTGVTPPTANLKKISLTFGTYRQIKGEPTDILASQPYHNSEYTYVIRVQGCTDYNATTHTGTWQDLAFNIEGKPDSNGGWARAEATAFAVPQVNAIRVIWDYMPGRQGVKTYYAVLHDIEILADITKYAMCQLAHTIEHAAHAGKPEYYFANDSYIKLRGGIKAGFFGGQGFGGSPRVKNEPIGAASGPSAISIARTMLVTSLQQYGQRHYVYEGPHPGTPELGLTIAVKESTAISYPGVLRSYTMSIREGGNTITTGAVLSTSAAVIT